MKSILQPIKPQYCELIAVGKKTKEVRKSRPKIETPFKVFIYMTKSNLVGDKKAYKGRMAGKVIGEYVCDRIDEYYPYIEGYGGVYLIPTAAYEKACLSYFDVKRYGNGKTLYFWYISDLKIYDKPKELSEFKKYNRDCYYDHLGFAIPSCDDCDKCNLTRPPQSWCYVEEI